MRGLYAIVDTSALAHHHLDLAAFTEAVLDARPAAIQLRDKSASSQRTLRALREIAPLARRAGVPLFANDRADLAILARADGVHVGQDDLPPPLVRSLSSTLRIGLSTHHQSQLDAALGDLTLDYVALGPIFGTTSKEHPSPAVGLEALRALSEHARALRPTLPLVTIGGITLESARQVGALCDAVAVIGALLPAPGEGLVEISQRARALHQAIVGAGTAS
jgi:thiamine-phosphate pyrophosphorylase